MQFINFAALTAAPETEAIADAAETVADYVTIEPNAMNFVTNLQYMGVGMLAIFVVMGIIITATAVLNKVASRKPKEEEE